MKHVLIAVVFLLMPVISFAADDDSRIAELWQCELKDGKTMDQLQANNVKWLALTRTHAGTDDIQSYRLDPVVGDLSKFMFIDSYPNMAAWASAKSAESTEEGKAIDATFDEIMECGKNRLYKGTSH